MSLLHWSKDLLHLKCHLCYQLEVSYDFNFTETNKLTAALAFSANSFSNDQFRLGLNYEMALDKAKFNMMAGYVYEKGIFSAEFDYEYRVTALSGLSAGVSVDAILGKSQNMIGVQYAFRQTALFDGVHFNRIIC